MDTLRHDIRYAARMLWKHRLATVICATALALGIGANIAIFSLAEAFLFRPVPLADVDRVLVLMHFEPHQSVENKTAVAPATYLEWQSQSTSFEKMGAYSWDGVNFTGDGPAQKIQDFRITPNFFSVLGVQPALGRDFLPQEGERGNDNVLILSYGLWERRYGGDRNVLGQTVKVDGRPFKIVGVMAKGFDYPLSAEAWLPMAFDVKERLNRDNKYLWVLGRLKPGITPAQANSEMLTIARRQADAYPESYKNFPFRMTSLAEYTTGDLTRQYTLLLLGAVAFVLLIACADVANVQFARVSGRQKELAVRAAMGASRSRIVRQLLIESVMLSLIGAVAGIFLAQWMLVLFLSNMPPDIARYIAGWKTIRLDLGAFMFTFAVALVSGIVSGILPSLMSTRADVSETLKESARGSSSGRARHRLRSALVIAEIALALVLLVGAGLLVKGVNALVRVNQNYHPESLLTLNLDLSDTQYPQKSSRAAFHDRMLRDLASIPGVRSVGMASAVPYANGGGTWSDRFDIENRPLERREDTRSAIIETVSPNYFSMMNIGLKDGRVLSDADGPDSRPVAVISESLAHRYFGSENPLGKRIRLSEGETNPWMTVTGIVDDVKYNWIQKDLVPTLYLSYKQSPPQHTTLVLRTDGQPAQFIPAVREKIAAADSELPIYEVKSLSVVIHESIIGITYVAAMMGVIGIVALVLASVGVYGVMSYSVSERTHEMGIRMALGATGSSIHRLVIGNGMMLTGIGMAIGLPIAFVLARALSSLLFGVEAADSFSFIGLPLILGAIAALASYLPARRAVRVDPLTALRYE